MAFVNACLELRIGNVDARIAGPAPRQLLDRALNPHLANAPEGSRAPVYDPVRERFLAGALPAAKRLLRRAGARLRIRDDRASSTQEFHWRLQGVELRDYQQQVVAAAIRRGCGLIDVGTGGGKTLLAAAIIARLGLPALYLVTTRTLLAQTVEALRRLLGTEPGVVGQGERRPGPLTVALVQALGPADEDLARWRGGTLVFDEGHHAAATTYLDLIRSIDPRFHFYLSAVPFRAGADQVVLDALAGPPLTGRRFSAQYLIGRGYACPVEVRVEHCVISGAMTEKPFGTLYREFITRNAARNRRIAELAQAELAGGRSVLVLVDHVHHGAAIASLLDGRAAFVHGGTARTVLERATTAFARRAPGCLVATSGLFAEGISISGIEALIQAGGLKSRAKVIQSIGRGMRCAPGKSSCAYVDFWDDDEAGVLRAHSRERLRVLKEEGFDVPPVPRPPSRAADREEIEPTWAHVAGTRKFLLIDGDGAVRAKALCIDKGLVPETHCRRCPEPEPRACRRGGLITWRADPD